MLPLPEAGPDGEAGTTTTTTGDDGGGEAASAVGDDGGAGAVVMPALPDCPAPLSCQAFSAPGPDGQCHGVTAACVLVCQTTADCAPLGKNAVCLPACTRDDAGMGDFISVCTPFE